MNWSTLLKFRKQVEELAREAVVLGEWERSREAAQQASLQEEMRRIACELDRNLRAGVETAYAEQRYRWMEELAAALEAKTRDLHALDRRLVELRAKLRQAHHARRVVEIVIAKKEAAIMERVARQERQELEDIGVRQHLVKQCEELA